MKIARWSLVILLAVPLGMASAAPRQQSQQSNSTDQDPLAAAARRAREQKKNAPKATKVWNNDDIPAGAVSVVGQPSGQPGTSESSAASSTSTEQPATPEDKQALEAKASSDKDKLANLKSELDILQRKLKLDQQTYYGQTNYADDKAGAAALQAEQDQIDAKKKEIEEAQKQVDDAQSKLDAANAEAASESNSSNSSSSANDNSNSSTANSSNSAASNSGNSNANGSNPGDANSGANPGPPAAPPVPADNETVPLPD